MRRIPLDVPFFYKRQPFLLVVSSWLHVNHIIWIFTRINSFSSTARIQRYRYCMCSTRMVGCIFGNKMDGFFAYTYLSWSNTKSCRKPCIHKSFFTSLLDGRHSNAFIHFFWWVLLRLVATAFAEIAVASRKLTITVNLERKKKNKWEFLIYNCIFVGVVLVLCNIMPICIIIALYEVLLVND